MWERKDNHICRAWIRNSTICHIHKYANTNISGNRNITRWRFRWERNTSNVKILCLFECSQGNIWNGCNGNKDSIEKWYGNVDWMIQTDKKRRCPCQRTVALSRHCDWRARLLVERWNWEFEWWVLKHTRCPKKVELWGDWETIAFNDLLGHSVERHFLWSEFHV